MIAYIAHWTAHKNIDSSALGSFIHGIYELMNKMWWGLAIGIIAVGLMAAVPKAHIQSLLGKGGTLNGILRATGAGLLLDMCNHGILLVAMQLYRSGASIGQTLAFIIASPWNSLSLTLILVALIGLPYTLLFVLLSGLIAIITGYIADRLVAKGKLPPNSATLEPDPNFKFFAEMKKGLKNTKFDFTYFKNVLINGFRESKSILKWIFLGAILAAAIRSFVSQDAFADWFGPTLAGLGLTLIAATVIEVCSEGSSPIAADLLTRASAPGNSFTFLMAGAATDYTEIMTLRETTKSWKLTWILPLLTIPQVLIIGILINYLSQ